MMLHLAVICGYPESILQAAADCVLLVDIRLVSAEQDHCTLQTCNILKVSSI